MISASSAREYMSTRLTRVVQVALNLALRGGYNAATALSITHDAAIEVEPART
jgi:hypothetical protein